MRSAAHPPSAAHGLRRHAHRITPVALLLLLGMGFAAETGNLQAAGAKTDDVRALSVPVPLATAEALLDSGRVALRTYREDQVANRDQLVSAARDFRAAIALLHTQRNTDALPEAESCLFWCKKQMDLAQMRDFLGPSDTEANASSGAAATPDDRPAQSSPAQPTAPNATAPDTLFSRLAERAGQRTAPPGEGRFSRLREQVRSTYRQAYQRTAADAKRVLARTLIADSDRSETDGELRYTMLQESLRLAIETADLPIICAATSRIGSSFNGPAGGVLLRQHLPRLLDPRLRQAIVQLLNNPREPHANSVIGRELCSDPQAWDLGLPLLANGDVQRWSALAQADLAQPATADGIRAVADGWYAIASNLEPAELRNGTLARAAYWYRRLGHDAGVTARLAEIEQNLPLDLERMPWAQLSSAAWERLPGKLLYVPCARDRIGPVLLLHAGERVRVVPHPQETWILAGDLTCTANGLPTRTAVQAPYPGFPVGCLVQQLDTGAPAACGEVAGPGALFLIPNRSAGANHGEIRVKLVPLDPPGP